jgi:DNA-binding NtrC family response regulator
MEPEGNIIAKLNEDLKNFKDNLERNNSVLVIDDEEVMLTLFNELLTREGYKVSLANSGEKALENLGSTAVNLLVVDKNLPGISGLETIREARRINPDVEAMIITGYASVDSALEAMEMGAYDYLTKPFRSLDVVKGKVERALKRQNHTLIYKKIVAELKGITEKLIKAGVPGEEGRWLLGKFQNELKRFKEELEWKNTVLIVEGEGAAREAMVSSLSEKGYDLLYCSNADEGILTLKQNYINLLIVNKDLPDSTGFELIDAARRIEPNLCAIIVANSASLDTVLRAMEVGACDYILRPLEGPDILEAKVKKALREQNESLKYKKLISELRNLWKELVYAKEPEEKSFFEEMAEDEEIIRHRKDSDRRPEVKGFLEEMIGQEEEIFRRLEESHRRSEIEEKAEIRAEEVPPAITEPEPAKEPKREEVEGQVSILIIDDEEVVLGVLRELLTKDGYKVILARRGEEGLKILKEAKANLIIADKNLPGISGLDVIREAKEIDPEIEAVLLTGYGSMESAMLAMRLGVCNYVVKPFESMDQIRGVIKEALKKQSERVRVKKQYEDFSRENEELMRRYSELKEKARAMGVKDLEEEK